VSSQPNQSNEPNGLASGSPVSAARTAVVAEDEAIIRLDLVELLTEQGIRVVGQASNGEDAVQQAVALGPDIVFLDISMPERDGLSAAMEIRALRIAPVVMLTAFAQRDIVQQAATAGAMGYLIKPFTASDLVAAMEIAFARWAEFMELDGERQALQQRLAQREQIDLAKARVQRELGLTEPEAFAWMRRCAMDRRVTLSEVAVSLVAGDQLA